MMKNFSLGFAFVVSQDLFPVFMSELHSQKFPEISKCFFVFHKEKNIDSHYHIYLGFSSPVSYTRVSSIFGGFSYDVISINSDSYKSFVSYVTRQNTLNLQDLSRLFL